MKLTNEAVAALKLDGKKDRIVFDDALVGFGYRLRVGVGGRVLKSWIAQYRRAGATRRMLLGSAEVLSAEKARAAAKEVLAKVALGQDPSADRADRQAKDKLTFRKAVAEYLETKERRQRPNTFAETGRYLNHKRYFGPLHSMPLDSITRQDVARRIKTIERASGTTAAGAAWAKLSAFFTSAMQDGLVNANPVEGARKPPGNKPRDRKLSDNELASIWNACGEDDYGRIVRLLILTACRREEIGGMAWGEFGSDGTWTLPAARAKNGREHVLPVLPAMRAILDGVPRRVGRERLFGDRSPDGFQSWDTHTTALDKRSGVTGWQLRDIRRSVATGMADLGVLPHVIEQILNHVSGHKGGVAGIYNRSSYANEVRAALALWGDRIQSLVTGQERKVLPLATRAQTAI
jgi:integrase